MSWAGRRATVAGVISMAVIVLAGCGSTVAGTPVAGSQSAPQGIPTEESTAPTETGSTATSEPGTNGDRTEPGATLSVGDTAVVDHKGEEDQVGTVKITVTAIEEGDIADFADFDLDDELVDATPYYVQATFENVDLATGGNPGVNMIGADDGGERQRPIILFGSFEQCPSGNTSGEEWTPGNAYDTCMTYLIKSGHTLAAVEYSQAGTDYFQTPVAWQQ